MSCGYVNLKAPTKRELHKKCLEIEARGYEPVAPMKEFTKVRKDFSYNGSKLGPKHRFAGYDMSKEWRIAYRRVEQSVV